MEVPGETWICLPVFLGTGPEYGLWKHVTVVEFATPEQ
jgi:hypothetical protein